MPVDASNIDLLQNCWQGLDKKVHKSTLDLFMAEVKLLLCRKLCCIAQVQICLLRHVSAANLLKTTNHLKDYVSEPNVMHFVASLGT